MQGKEKFISIDKREQKPNENAEKESIKHQEYIDEKA